MQVIFYKDFKKRINSTKRPSGGTAIECLMKKETDLHSPTLDVNTSETEYNYMQIGDKYYYVTSVTVMPNNYVRYSATIDDMATCAEDVKSTSAFVERCSAGSLAIGDTLVPNMSTGEVIFTATQLLTSFSRTGCYVVSLSNMVSPVVMDIAEVFGLYNKLNDLSIWEQLKDYFNDLSSYVQGVVWLPFDKGEISMGGTINIKAGFVETGLTASIIASDFKQYGHVFPLPIDDTILTSSQFCDLELYLPFVGAVKLSIDDFKANKTLLVTWSMDNHTGDISYIISDTANHYIASFGGTCGVPIPIGSSGYNAGGVGTGVVTAVGGYLSGNPLMLAAGAGMALSSARSSSQTSGGSGSRAGLVESNIKVSICKKGNPESLTAKSKVAGLPTYRTLNLGTLNGYVKCYGASIVTKHLDSAEAVNSYLNSGAWIE